MEWKYADGGRLEWGRSVNGVGDCACRALALVTLEPYPVIYDLINKYAEYERTGSRKKGKSSARNGVYKQTMHKVCAELGLKWFPTMGIGTGCKVHLRDGELPFGRLVCAVSKHYVAVIDNVIYDRFDPSRNGTRCVYGYWKV